MLEWGLKWLYGMLDGACAVVVVYSTRWVAVLNRCCPIFCRCRGTISNLILARAGQAVAAQHTVDVLSRLSRPVS